MLFYERRYEVARAFVLNGARVIMVNRKEEQGEAAIERIKQEAGKDAQIEWMPCDMGNLRQIKETFSKLREREGRLDLVSIVLTRYHYQRASTHILTSSFSWLVSTQTSTAKQPIILIAISKSIGWGSTTSVTSFILYYGKRRNCPILRLLASFSRVPNCIAWLHRTPNSLHSTR